MALNVLLITADDMDADTPGTCVGGVPVTPRLDALAAEGIRFGRAHVAAAVCQPSRSALMSGRWPHRNGAEGFEPMRDDVPLLTDALRDAGYAVGILGKVEHIQPVERFGWDHVAGMAELGLGRDPSRYAESARAFMDAASADGRPWFLMANAHDPHRPFHGSLAEEQKWTDEQRATYSGPSAVFGVEAPGVEAPGFLPGLPDVTKEFAQYLSSSRRCDDVVGALLDELDAAGVSADTLVLFLSDNGMAFPFAKANCYVQSTLTPFIVRWPGVVAPGRVDERHFISMLDLLPTICEATGASPRGVDGLDGTSFVGLLAGRSEPVQGRERVFSVFHETSAKERFEMRCVQDEQWGYVWNEWATGDRAYRAENMEGLTWPAMVDAAAGDLDVAARVDFYLHRSPEELYDLEADPDSLSNLASQPGHSQRLEQCREVLEQWMRSTDDPLLDRFVDTVQGQRPA